ncbi:uncharacterized protein LOC113799560 [Dermatophagoides pteronyssinus]
MIKSSSSSSLKQTLPQNNCDRMSGIPLSLADRLFEYRCQLDLSNEMIKLLEQQRSLYRSHFEHCKCHSIDLDLQQQTKWRMDRLRQIDDQLETLYRKRYDPQSPSSSDSDVKYSMLNSSDRWPDKRRSRMLGIDMKTFLSQQLKDSSYDKKPMKPKVCFRRRFKCSVDKKCRFVCLTETVLLRHQIEHRRDKFLQLIQPYGLTLASDSCKVIKIKDNSNEHEARLTSSQCSFPFCTFKFSATNPDWQSKLSQHFEQDHLSAYIMHPCFICRRMFETQDDLQRHFNFSLICSSLNQQAEQPMDFDAYESKPENSAISSKQLHSIGSETEETFDDDPTTSMNDLINGFDDNIGLEVFIENTTTPNNTEPNNTDELILDNFFDHLDSAQQQTMNSDEIQSENQSNKVDNISLQVLAPDYNYCDDRDHTYHTDGPSLTTAPSLVDDHDDYTKNNDDQYPILFETSTSKSGEFSSSPIIEHKTSLESSSSPLIMTSKSSELTVIDDKTFGDDEHHLKQLFNLYIYECTKCSYSFQSEREFSLHNYIVHNIPSYNCGRCEYVTQDTEKYNRHVQLHDKSKNNDKADCNMELSICTICSESFSSEFDLRQHLNDAHQSYRCPHCDVLVMNKFVLRSHMQSFHPDSVQKCPVCSYKTFDPILYEQHCRRHNHSKCCTFPGCTDEFANEDSLEAHVNRFHRFTKPFECDECLEKFYSSRMLNKHLINMHKRFLYSCNQCTFKTNNKSVLTKHEQCHSSVKPFECQEQGCYRRFRSRYQLSSHQRHRHCQRKDFHCTQQGCEREFKTNAQLRQHLRSAHLESNNDGINEKTSAKIKDDLTKKPNIQFYVFGGGSLQVANIHPQQSLMNTAIKSGSNHRLNLSNKHSTITGRSLIKSNIARESTSILTTTITKIDENDVNN